MLGYEIIKEKTYQHIAKIGTCVVKPQEKATTKEFHHHQETYKLVSRWKLVPDITRVHSKTSIKNLDFFMFYSQCVFSV